MPPYPPERVNELCDLILERLTSGVLLAKVLRMPDIDVAPSTFKAWRKARPDLDEAVEEARAAGFDVIASDSLDIKPAPMHVSKFSHVILQPCGANASSIRRRTGPS